MDGSLHRDGDTFVIRFERLLAHPIDRVWSALTEHDRLAEWLGPTDVHLRPGGAIRIEFSGVEPPAVLDTVVDEIDPPRVLQFRFDDRAGDGNMVRFELDPHGEQTRLTLTQSRVPSVDELANNAAGWHMRLDMLGAALDHGTRELAWPEVERLNRHYATAVDKLSPATSR